MVECQFAALIQKRNLEIFKCYDNLMRFLYKIPSLFRYWCSGTLVSCQFALNSHICINWQFDGIFLPTSFSFSDTDVQELWLRVNLPPRAVITEVQLSPWASIKQNVDSRKKVRKSFFSWTKIAKTHCLYRFLDGQF